jgi:hypothetical protein
MCIRDRLRLPAVLGKLNSAEMERTMRDYRCAVTCVLYLLLAACVFAGCTGKQASSQPADPHSGIFDQADSPWPSFPIERVVADLVPFSQNGSQAIQKSSNATISGNNLILPGSTGQVEYGLFRFSTNGDPLLNVKISKSPPLSTSYYLGIANYETFRWQISGPFNTNENTIPLTGGNYNSPGNHFYVFVAVFGGPAVTLQGITLEVDSTLPTFGINGTVLEQGSPVAGVLMTLGGQAGGSTNTDAQGFYSFSGLPDGNYTITPSKSNTSFTPISQNVTINGGDQTGVNFTATTTPSGFTVSGKVLEGANGLAGVTLTLTPGNLSATSDAAGNYVINNVPNNGYTMLVEKTNYTFVPSSLNVLVNNANVTNPDITGTPQGVQVTYETGLGQIRQLVGVNGCKCSPCHVTQQDGSVRFNTYANITANGQGGQPVYDRIKVRAIDLGTMPPNSNKLTEPEKQLYLDWLAAGHPQ